MNYSHLFGEEKIPFKEELEDCLKKLLTSSSRKTFGLTQTRLFQLLSNDGVGAYRMASGYTVLEFVEILMQQGEYICLSQM
jgi:type II secretory pathway component PulC